MFVKHYGWLNLNRIEILVVHPSNYSCCFSVFGNCLLCTHKSVFQDIQIGNKIPCHMFYYVFLKHSYFIFYSFFLNPLVLNLGFLFSLWHIFNVS
jgi:hypothetical protein